MEGKRKEMKLNTIGYFSQQSEEESVASVSQSKYWGEGGMCRVD